VSNPTAVPLSLIIIRPQIEKHLQAIADILPAHYKVTMVARSDKHPNAEIVLTEDNLYSVYDVLRQHARAQQ
jgi:hypothetical protein